MVQEIEYNHKKLIELVRDYSSYQEFDTKDKAEAFARMKESNGQKVAMMKVWQKWNVFFR